MKYCLAFFLLILSSGALGQKPTLKIEVVGFESDKGVARIGVYNSKEDFGKEGKQVRGYLVKIENKKAYIEVKDLPKGWYAIAAYHDLNDNGKLDKNFMGVPSEVYGFSRDARATFSAPDYADAVFQLEGEVLQKFMLN